MKGMRRLFVLLLLPAVAAAATPAAGQTLREIPPAFRGGWDETANGCAGFEPRFSITARSVRNFEVQWQVRRVRRLSRTRIEVVARHVDHDGRVTAGRRTWRFRLVDNGRAIAGSGVTFRRCARPVSRG
jgi:hypothetical protein